MTDKKPLNSNTIAAMKAGSSDLADIGENRGLRVSCAPAGTKSFYYRYKSPITGKLTQVHLGRFPELSLANARVQLVELKKIRNQGRCPASEQKLKKKQDQLARQGEKFRSFTVQDLVDLYLEKNIEDRFVGSKLIKGSRKKKGQREVRRTLYADVVKVLGDKQASEIHRKDIVMMIQNIIDRGSNVQAGNVLRELTAAYEFAIGFDMFDDDFANPALLAKSSLNRTKVRLTSKKGSRILNDAELTKLLNWLPGSAFTPTQKNVLRFTLWTGCRTGEVCNAKWEDVDLVSGVWQIKTKTETERYVQLPNQAVEFLNQLKFVTGQYLFPSQKTGLSIQQKSITEQAWQLRTTNRMINIDHWTPHDLRRTVRTGLSRLGCPSEVGEAVLGHSKKGIEGTYNLHRYESECRQWLQKWADYMDDLLRK